MRITKNQLKQIIKEELKNTLDEQRDGSFAALGKAMRSIGRDIVPGGLKSEDQDLMDKAMAGAKAIYARKPLVGTGNSPVHIFKGGNLYPSQDESSLAALSRTPVKQIYHLILAMNLDSEQMQRVVKHLGPKVLAQGVVDAVDGVIKINSGMITMDDFHPNIQTNYEVAQGMIADFS